jgi:hypothetical protein
LDATSRGYGAGGGFARGSSGHLNEKVAASQEIDIRGRSGKFKRSAAVDMDANIAEKCLED